jgi:hypothetical protein
MTSTSAIALTVVLGVLVVLVFVLALVWAYIFYTRIRPRRRHTFEEAIGCHYRDHVQEQASKVRSSSPAGDQQEGGEQGPGCSQPFLIWHYTKRIRFADVTGNGLK